jgi:hypothetical protein
MSKRDAELEAVFGRHLRVGWWSLFGFLALGLVLEGLHGFKVAWYLDASQQTRRLMWTLGHAHGTLLGLVNLAFAASVRAVPGWDGAGRRQASLLLLAATLLMPGGFVLAGLDVYAGDPGVGIVAVAAGGLLLAAAVLITAVGTGRASRNASA